MLKINKKFKVACVQMNSRDNIDYNIQCRKNKVNKEHKKIKYLTRHKKEIENNHKNVNSFKFEDENYKLF